MYIYIYISSILCMHIIYAFKKYTYINTTYITCPGCTSNLNLFPARWHDAKFGINDQSVCDDNVQGVLQRDIESILPCLSVSVCVRIRFNIHAIE